MMYVNAWYVHDKEFIYCVKRYIRINIEWSSTFEESAIAKLVHVKHLCMDQNVQISHDYFCTFCCNFGA